MRQCSAGGGRGVDSRAAQQGHGADCLQRPVVPRSRFRQQLMPGVNNISINSIIKKPAFLTASHQYTCLLKILKIWRNILAIAKIRRSDWSTRTVEDRVRSEI